MKVVSIAGFVLSAGAGADAAGQGTHTVSWLGDSIPGGHKWVQQDIENIHVTANGTPCAVIDWDEAGAEVTPYQDADVVAVAGHTHGWGYHGGSPIAVNGEYLVFLEDDRKAKVLMYRWKPE